MKRREEKKKIEKKRGRWREADLARGSPPSAAPSLLRVKPFGHDATTDREN